MQGPGRPDIVNAGSGETRYSECRVLAAPAQRIADPRAGAISSNDTPPTLENAPILGTEVPVRAAFSKEVQGLLSCVSRARDSIQMNGLLCPCKMRPARPQRCEPGRPQRCE
ncbi:unnamed protein product, partial [Staurois parvus]